MGSRLLEKITAEMLKTTPAEYHDVIETKPAEVAAFFRQLHRDDTDKKERAGLAHEILQALLFKPSQSQWTAFVDSGLHEAYVEILMDESIYVSGDEYPMKVVWGLYNIMFMARTQPAYKNEKVTNALLEKGPPLFAMFWSKRHLLQEQTNASRVQELYREYVSMFAFVYVEALTQKSGYPGLLESKIAHVTLYCWQYASKAGLVKSLTDTVVILSGAFFRLASRADLDAFAQEAIVDTYGAQAFIERIRRDLKASHVFDQSLVSVLTFLIDLGPHPAIMRVLGKVDMFHLILDAAARQTRKSSNKEMEFLVYGFSAIMLYNVFGLNAISLMEACNEDQLVPFLVHGVMLHAQYVNVLQIENMSTLLEFLGKLLRRYRTDKSIPFGDVTSQALAQRLRRVWVSTLDKIRALPSRQSRNKMANMWVFFGEGVGLDEATERARGKVEEPLKLQGPPYCHWKECEFYAKEPRKEMLRCSGCSSVQYCGKECQEKDWKDGGHKRLCKVLKAKKREEWLSSVGLSGLDL